MFGDEGLGSQGAGSRMHGMLWKYSLTVIARVSSFGADRLRSYLRCLEIGEGESERGRVPVNCRCSL